jgi:hypothetical protein
MLRRRNNQLERLRPYPLKRIGQDRTIASKMRALPTKQDSRSLENQGANRYEVCNAPVQERGVPPLSNVLVQCAVIPTIREGREPPVVDAKLIEQGKHLLH